MSRQGACARDAHSCHHVVVSPGGATASWAGGELLHAGAAMRLAVNCAGHTPEMHSESGHKGAAPPATESCIHATWNISIEFRDESVADFSTGTAYSQGMSPKQAVGVGQAQLEWLQGVLSAAERQGERVIVATHDPVHQGERRPHRRTDRKNSARPMCCFRPVVTLRCVAVRAQSAARAPRSASETRRRCGKCCSAAPPPTWCFAAAGRGWRTAKRAGCIL